MEIESLLRHFKGLTQNGHGWMAKCPAHDDANPSLSIGDGDGGRILLHCFAGCNLDEILNAAGLKVTDLFPEQGASNGAISTAIKTSGPISKGGLDKAKRYCTHLQENFDTLTSELPWALKAVRETGTGYDPDTGRFVFVHRDSQGQVVNIKHHKGADGSRPYSLEGRGQTRLYPAHLLKGYDTADLIFCEGEKDAVTLRSHGFQAITGTTGAGSIPPDLSILSKFKTITVFNDNDKAGETGSAKIADAILHSCPGVTVSIAEWPVNKPQGYDISDFFNEGGSADDFEAEMLSGLNPYQASVPPNGAGDPMETLPYITRNGQVTFMQTETGQAEYFAHLNGGRLCYNHSAKSWFVYIGHWWQRDTVGKVVQLAKEAASNRYHAAPSLDNQRKMDREAKFAIKLFSRAKIDAVLKLAQSEPPLADSGDGWDADPWLLGVANGVVDLRTGNLRDGKPEDKISKQTGIPFNPNSKPETDCRRWLQFLDEIFNGDKDQISFIKQAIGYSLTGSTKEQVYFICWGGGANGKSVFLSTLRHVFGDYAWNTSFSTLEQSRKTSTEDLINLKGRRLVTASETSGSKRLNESRIKALTGGDAITARHLYESEQTFTPEATLWLVTNHKPIVRDDSDGFWRRVLLIPFVCQFMGEDDDTDLLDKLLAQAPGILAWAVDGCLEWQARGKLEVPIIVKQATEAYRLESDPLAEFLAEKCETGAGLETRAADLYRAYSAWTESEGMKGREVLSKTGFGRLIGEKFGKRKGKAGNIYQMIGLKE